MMASAPPPSPSPPEWRSGIRRTAQPDRPECRIDGDASNREHQRPNSAHRLSLYQHLCSGAAVNKPSFRVVIGGTVIVPGRATAGSAPLLPPCGSHVWRCTSAEAASSAAHGLPTQQRVQAHAARSACTSADEAARIASVDCRRPLCGYRGRCGRLSGGARSISGIVRPLAPLFGNHPWQVLRTFAH